MSESIQATARKAALTWSQRWRLFLGITYQCRCGALVATHCRQQHEGFHDAIREFCAPPTAEEIAALKVAQFDHQTGREK